MHAIPGRGPELKFVGRLNLTRQGEEQADERQYKHSAQLKSLNCLHQSPLRNMKFSFFCHRASRTRSTTRLAIARGSDSASQGEYGEERTQASIIKDQGTNVALRAASYANALQDASLRWYTRVHMTGRSALGLH